MNPNRREPPAAEPKQEKYRSLMQGRVDPGRPRGEQVPQSTLAPRPPKGRDLTGIAVRSK